jgi:farnesyl diphosphate synthase
MAHAVLDGGKRFRPHLVRVSCRLFGASDQSALQVATAVEILHAASLALDDLPAMDAADRRRDGASLHRRFGESGAILAATALIARAFELLSQPAACSDAETRSKLVGGCAIAIGAGGISGGQALDLAGEEGAPHKTADLIAFCCEAGPLLGQADPAVSRMMRDYGISLGRIFQGRDDALDMDASSSSLVYLAQGQQLAGRLHIDFGYPPDASAELSNIIDWAATRRD